MHMKMSSAKYPSFCSGRSVLTQTQFRGLTSLLDATCILQLDELTSIIQIINRSRMPEVELLHNKYVIMSTMVFQITGVSIVCSTVCSGADRRKHQSSTSLAFVRENPAVAFTKGQ